MRRLATHHLCEKMVKAVKEDKLLYKALASIDIIPVGRVREMKVAIAERKRSFYESSNQYGHSQTTIGNSKEDRMLFTFIK